MKRFVASLLLVASVVLIGLAIKRQPSDDLQESTRSRRTPGGATAQMSDRVLTEQSLEPHLEERFQRVVANMWWHQPRFERNQELKLRTDQIERMDALCLEMLRRRLLLRRQVRNLEPLFDEALGGLDLELAARRLEDLREQASELALIEESLVLDVLALFDKEQLETLRQDHPAILQRPWLKSVGGRSGLKPGGGRPGLKSDADGGASENARSREAS